MNAHIGRKILKWGIYIVLNGLAINMTDVSEAAKKQKQNLRDGIAKIKENKEESLRMRRAEANKKRKY